MKAFLQHESLQRNNRLIISDIEISKTLEELEKQEVFLNNLSTLLFGRSFNMCRRRVFSLQRIVQSMELTVGSILDCCSSGCLADANTLVRKYRDDSLFCLYIIACAKERMEERPIDRLTEMEDQIERWLNNNLEDLNTNIVMKTISQTKAVEKAIESFDIKSHFDSIGRTLNNYVHSNGTFFYNSLIAEYNISDYRAGVKELLNNTRYITATFVLLLTLYQPFYIMSSDYCDALESGEIPVQGTEYLVAPFITDYLKENLELIDKDAMNYLRNETSMIFE